MGSEVCIGVIEGRVVKYIGVIEGHRSDRRTGSEVCIGVIEGRVVEYT